MIADLTHLDSIRQRKHIHLQQLAATANPQQIEWSKHHISMIEKEEAGELAFLERKYGFVEAPIDDLSDDDLLALLGN